MTPTLDFAVVKQSGITQGQFAEMCGVSREAANLWMNARTRPSKVRARRVDKVLLALRKAVARGTLPVTTDTPHRAAQRVLDAIATTLKD